MTLWIDELARDAADPLEAGRKMRRVFFALGKVARRQLTVNLLRKLCERRVGTHEIEKVAQNVIKGGGRRNLTVIDFLLKTKLDDALKWTERTKQQFMREKENLYTTINRGGLVKERF